MFAPLASVAWGLGGPYCVTSQYKQELGGVNCSRREHCIPHGAGPLANTFSSADVQRDNLLEKLQFGSPPPSRPPTPIRLPTSPTHEPTALNLDPAPRPPALTPSPTTITASHTDHRRRTRGPTIHRKTPMSCPNISLSHSAPNPHSHTSQLRPPSKSPREIDSALAILDTRPRHLPSNSTAFRTLHLSPNTIRELQPNLRDEKTQRTRRRFRSHEGIA